MAKKTEYERQKEIWYKKLEKSGFEDIERGEHALKDYNIVGKVLRNGRTIQAIEATTEYYTMAEHFLNEHKFTSKQAQIIWEYHVNGLSYRDIAKLLKNLKYKKNINRTSVCLIVKDLVAIMYKKNNVR